MTDEKASLSAGKYIENHSVIHNMWFNSSTWEKKSYYKSQFVNEWWDSGSLPIWIRDRYTCLMLRKRVCRIDPNNQHVKMYMQWCRTTVACSE